ncbi:glutamate--tRNA ligase [Galbibacter pacificus]|uniref:Glutamate--tRNA ligase n=1 Tax=Galbibacter pacificus TaxID=2996052 RepID=A0ABT6FRL3_9FLAO|nr:glutamate--tRNA ligase [Galbibacter pacificus]MDG3583000.1 glutamate--tRNA ligase [Galbibacter pacificus]MDG3585881.1 glutamate--tRNA ligase [Galbibacter pacificus]
MSTKVRVRFAPSPTGPLHIGGVRTALFNYLFAKKHGGDFILRIEDTDQNRYVEGAERYIVDSLNWLNIPYDEGPGSAEETQRKYGSYRQSERRHLYKQYADLLLEKGWAYYAFDTADELDAHRKEHEAKGKTFIYNWHNRQKLKNSLALTQDEVQQKIDAGHEYVIRFKSPQDEKLHLKDIIRGDMEIDTNILDDKVLFKSDGMPTYHLANIVDDHLMEITHVIRGEEWLPSLALHVLLYRAFDWQEPQFAHLPLILKPTGKGKLSKRDGDKMGFPVFPLEWRDPSTGTISRGYKEDGYFNDAVINFLAFLGWNPGTEQEIFSLNGLIEAFQLEKVHKAGARFDPDKTKWYNHQYLQQKSNKELTGLFMDFIASHKVVSGEIAPSLVNKDYITNVVALIKERADFVADFWTQADFFFVAPSAYDEKAAKKQWKENTNEYMDEVAGVIAGIDNFASENIETIVKQWISNRELGFGKIMPPLRLALVGAMKGPHVFDIIALIGKEETTYRINKAIEVLG